MNATTSSKRALDDAETQLQPIEQIRSKNPKTKPTDITNSLPNLPRVRLTQSPSDCWSSYDSNCTRDAANKLGTVIFLLRAD
ncbi:hypothetical protein PsorP6_002124 [Peronosclerospora sorghi]|uniref:Uncharacterized protein n=1 Tax=Peronosclerospora sorghi TaxID=230839 RepID=A0ACC0WWD6_9STRA|nr:hypothetical protein PsorP6_002124 [Peronosclerospora sorghi]